MLKKIQGEEEKAGENEEEGVSGKIALEVTE